jgi:KaiC/GvpD/RAD55 family RecA-like ATPase
MGIREITVLAAKPKTGKSTLALQIASDLYSQGIPILYFDFENGAFNLMGREVARMGNLTFGEIFSTRGEYSAFADGGILRLKEYDNFSIITDRKLTIDKIRSHIRQAKTKSGRPEVFMVIDSLQKLPMENLRERRAAIDFWLRGFEEIKSEEPEVSILLISEISRDGGKPKESGDIEYTGHFILRLETNKTEDELKNGPDDGIRKLCIESARDIETPKMPLAYSVDFCHWRFTELDGTI